MLWQWWQNKQKCLMSCLLRGNPHRTKAKPLLSHDFLMAFGARVATGYAEPNDHESRSALWHYFRREKNYTLSYRFTPLSFLSLGAAVNLCKFESQPRWLLTPSYSFEGSDLASTHFRRKKEERERKRLGQEKKFPRFMGGGEEEGMGYIQGSRLGLLFASQWAQLNYLKYFAFHSNNLNTFGGCSSSTYLSNSKYPSTNIARFHSAVNIGFYTY